MCSPTLVNRYALLGAASFLGGSMRMTVSLCVIMVEITNNLQLLPLIMLVLLISKVSSFLLCTNLFSFLRSDLQMLFFFSCQKYFLNLFYMHDPLNYLPSVCVGRYLSSF